MTTVCLVRHGETDWNVIGKLQGTTDIPLNEVGIGQAEECADHLAQSEWDLIITSPLLRAKGTAEIINKKLQIPLIEMTAFVERSFGDAEGMTAKERIAQFPDNQYPNQENRELFIKRLITGMEDIKQTHTNKKILLVAHGAVINAILAVLSNGKIGSGITILHNACLTTISSHDSNWGIVNYNEVSHLSNAKEATGLIL